MLVRHQHNPMFVSKHKRQKVAISPACRRQKVLSDAHMFPFPRTKPRAAHEQRTDYDHQGHTNSSTSWMNYDECINETDPAQAAAVGPRPDAFEPSIGYHRPRRISLDGCASDSPEISTLASTSPFPLRHTQPDEAADIPIDCWLMLPTSNHGNYYDIFTANVLSSSALDSGTAKRSPFEQKMKKLYGLMVDTHSKGAGLVYTREIFEPNDVDFRHGQRIDVTQLSHDQVDRLGLMVMRPELQQTLIAYLTFFDHAATSRSVNVVFEHFTQFKMKYSRLRSYEEKLCRLFSITFALNRYTWWLRVEGGHSERRDVIEGLALRWKNLLQHKAPHELGVDKEFSYPAIVALLVDFQSQIESALTTASPRVFFNFS